MDNKNLNDKNSDSEQIPDGKKILRQKTFIADLSDDDLYSEETSDKEPLKISSEESPKNPDTAGRKIFHSKKFVDSETQAQEDKEKSASHEPEIKRKLSHAETSGIAISAVMIVYSLSEGDKPLFFLSTSLLIFLLRPLIGALFGKHNRAVQNALHSFSLVLFIGALILLFL